MLVQFGYIYIYISDILHTPCTSCAWTSVEQKSWIEASLPALIIDSIVLLLSFHSRWGTCCSGTEKLRVFTQPNHVADTHLSVCWVSWTRWGLFSSFVAPVLRTSNPNQLLTTGKWNDRSETQCRFHPFHSAVLEFRYVSIYLYLYDIICIIGTLNSIWTSKQTKVFLIMKTQLNFSKDHLFYFAPKRSNKATNMLFLKATSSILPISPCFPASGRCRCPNLGVNQLRRIEKSFLESWDLWISKWWSFEWMPWERFNETFQKSSTKLSALTHRRRPLSFSMIRFRANFARHKHQPFGMDFDCWF